jgi:hypothetical protein
VKRAKDGSWREKVNGVWEESIKLPRGDGSRVAGFGWWRKRGMEASDLLTGNGVMDVAVGGFGEGDEGEIGAVKCFEESGELSPSASAVGGDFEGDAELSEGEFGFALGGEIIGVAFADGPAMGGEVEGLDEEIAAIFVVLAGAESGLEFETIWGEPRGFLCFLESGFGLGEEV